MMYLLRLAGSLFLLSGLCDSLQLNTTDCDNTCKKEEIANQDELCKKICVDKALKKHLDEVKGGPRQLPKPRTPRVLKTELQTIRINFNTTDFENISGLEYIVEVKQDWNHLLKNDVFTVFPYIPKYYLTNQTTYTVQELEPNVGYQFRVIALRLSEVSEFSGWSDITKTKKNCSNPPCGVTNMRIELTSEIPYQGPRELNSSMKWEPSSDISGVTPGNIQKLVITRLSTGNKLCNQRFEDQIFSYYVKFGEKDIFTKYTNFSIAGPDDHLYYDCWFMIELYIQKHPFNPTPLALRKWNFSIPDCINFENSTICGCTPTSERESKSVLNVTISSSNSSSSFAVLEWNDFLWRNDVNVTYYLVTFYHPSGHLSEYFNAHLNDHNYRVQSRYVLKTGEEYKARISAFHSDHCIHGSRGSLNFIAISEEYVCMNATCRANETCRKVLNTGKHYCECVPGTVLVKNNRTHEERCLATDPCEGILCGTNATCRILAPGQHACDCNKEYEDINGTCIYECDAHPNSASCTLRSQGSSEDYKAIIAGVVPTLIIVILIAVGTIIWLKYFHKKRMNFMQREFEDAMASGTHGTLRNTYDYQHPIELVTLPESSSKEMNLLYTLQENLIIPEDLKGSIGLYELPGEHIRLRSMIGKGAFGEVYIGEAQGVNDNPDWTTVAIKTLADVVKEEDVHDFLQEIDLMKNIGKHENVIQMYGCCTTCRPICLVLEYAPGGNLLNYLRSLKQKCKEIATARAHAFINAEKKKFEKFFEPGEMPDPSTSYSFPFDPYKRPKGSERTVEEVEALNLEIAAKIKEELRTALNTKELESFARQIACGMEHIANLDIIHRDLAARNILLGENKVLKISDFGLSREGMYVKQTVGKIPFRWLSIEAIVERTYTTASDVWAFGVVLWEICTLGDVPYSNVADKDLQNFLLTGKRLEKVDSCSDDIFEIMLKCWNHLPEDRPSFSELSKCLWDLEHTGSTYVNLDSLVQQSVDDRDDNENREGVEKENNNADDTRDAESRLPMTASGGLDNRAFSLSEENLSASDEKRLIRKYKESPSETPDTHKEISNGKVGNVKSDINSVNVE